MRIVRTRILFLSKIAAALVAAFAISATPIQSEPIYRFAGKQLKVTHDQTIKGLERVFMAKGVPIVAAEVGEKTGYIAVISNDYRSIVVDSVKNEKQQINTTWCEVVDSSGNTLYETNEGVQWASFNPEGDRLAVITGRRTMEMTGPMQLRLGIINLNDSSLTWLLGSDSTYSDSVDHFVDWTRTDEIYINGPKYEIYKVDPKSGKLFDTGWNGLLDISPDGRYLLINAARVVSGEFIQLIDLESGENLSPEFYQICGESWDKSDYGSRLAVRWLGSEKNLLGINLFQRALVIDVDKREILFDQPFSDINFYIHGWVTRPTIPLVVKNRQPTILELPEN